MILHRLVGRLQLSSVELAGGRMPRCRCQQASAPAPGTAAALAQPMPPHAPASLATAPAVPEGKMGAKYDGVHW